MRGFRGVGPGVPDTPSCLRKLKSVDYLKNTGVDPLEKYKATDVGSSSDR